MTKQDDNVYYEEQPMEDIIEFADKVFNWAKLANPQAKLLLNDFGMIADEKARSRFIELVSELKKRQTPISLIGIQSHEPLTDWYSPKDVWTTFDTLASFGYPLYVTELRAQSSGKDITGGWRKGTWTEEAQAEFTEQFVRLAFGHPSVQCINWHGLSDQHIWQDGGGLLNKRYRPKPVYTRVRKLVMETWHTHIDSILSENEFFNFNGFYGDYEIQLTTQDNIDHFFNISLSDNEENQWIFIIK